MLESYLKNQKERIERDLASFADPGRVKVNDVGERRLQAEWAMRGIDLEAMFTISLDRSVTVTIDAKSQPYADFLASTRMADLRHVAQMIRQAGHPEIFVKTKARRTDVAATDGHSATDLLADLLDRHEADTTQVVMVTGEAGAGKTLVLRELVLRQAGNYLLGKTEKLLLYVNAQGEHWRG